jgi:transposase
LADLRERALAACERREDSRAAIARRFSVSQSTLYDWLRQAHAEGRRCAKPGRGGRPYLDGGAAQAALSAAVREHSDATLAELAEMLAGGIGRRWSVSTVCRALQRLGWRRKKKTIRAAEQERPDVAAERAAWRRAVAAGQLAPERLIFIDESGIDTRMTRRFARAPRGKRACGAVPFGR